jgi:mitochondrial fission protein ELM1
VTDSETTGRPLTLWAVTTGEAGMRSQGLGLAEAIAAERPGTLLIEKEIGLARPWSFLPAHLCPRPLRHLDPAKDQLTPPWPDLLIACGRRSIAAALAVKKASRGATRIVYIQNPQAAAKGFDLVFPMTHDGLTGPNVIATDTALHRVTPEKLADGAREWSEPFSSLPRPLLGVILGGRNKHYRFTRDIGERLLTQLDQLHAATGAGVAITASRRTEGEIRMLIKAFQLTRPWLYVWNDSGKNPYFGIMALSDALLVTGDSVSMVSEALATGKPVGVVRLEGQGRRHELFLATLEARGAISRFDGSWPQPAATAIPNATLLARDAVLNLFSAPEKSETPPPQSA